ncbi:hypothetical protein [Belliella pelovolcani]|uniref:Uncharacterized protein n=1 Tax=Belliella pelovolcani TaxID=529505 RepID=A0A1N7KWU8_9BACT|nr:hypothetical protein [Belliella pelovolcani]SIS65890.1 hypothetical protein SAMN05421761_102395 [Belliella pelovolcani]
MKRILVTGGAGFLESHLCKRIIVKWQHSNSKSKLIFKPLPQDDPKQRMPDISIAQEKLVWSPNIHLQEGLIKTIEYFKNFI